MAKESFFGNSARKAMPRDSGSIRATGRMKGAMMAMRTSISLLTFLVQNIRASQLTLFFADTHWNTSRR